MTFLSSSIKYQVQNATPESVWVTSRVELELDTCI